MKFCFNIETDFSTCNLDAGEAKKLKLKLQKDTRAYLEGLIKEGYYIESDISIKVWTDAEDDDDDRPF